MVGYASTSNIAASTAGGGVPWIRRFACQRLQFCSWCRMRGCHNRKLLRPKNQRSNAPQFVKWYSGAFLCAWDPLVQEVEPWLTPGRIGFQPASSHGTGQHCHLASDYMQRAHAHKLLHAFFTAQLPGHCVCRTCPLGSVVSTVLIPTQAATCDG